MDMRVPRLVMIDPVGSLATGEHLFGYEGGDKGNVLGLVEFYRQRDDELSGKLRIGALFKDLDPVPEGFRALADRAIRHERFNPLRCISHMLHSGSVPAASSTTLRPSPRLMICRVKCVMAKTKIPYR